MKAILTAVLLASSTQLVMASELTKPRTVSHSVSHSVSQSRILSRSAPGPHHTKPSSFAPQGRSRNHVYGSPISTPILHRRQPAKKKPVTPASANAAQPGR